MDNYTKRLEEENERLKQELDKIYTDSEKSSKRKKGFIKFIGKTFAGMRLKKSIYKVLNQYQSERFVTKDAISDLLASLIYRFTRIGVFTLIFALLPFILLIQQNLLLKQQNKKIQDQNFLAEASRRSTQMFIMGDVLSDLNQERKFSKTITSTLAGRIASLSKAMRPYYYFEEGELIESPMSPERGQLLLTICKSDLSESQLSDEIFQNSDFTYAELDHVILRSAHLKDIDLAYSRLNFANLEGVDLSYASLANAGLYHTDLVDANLVFVNFSNADLTGSNLMYTKLKNANFTNAKMDSVKVDRIDWLDYIKNELQLKGSESLHKKYKVDSIYDKELERKLPMLLKK
jgi:uncharacterized protein YjbI with pentapeptide repeats